MSGRIRWRPPPGRLAQCSVERMGRVKPLLGNNYTISAYCPSCKAITSFDQKQSSAVAGPHTYNGKNYHRVLYFFSQCARCGRGGLSTIPDNGSAQTAVLEAFYPITPDEAPLPKDVPNDIKSEFREAERCAAFGANRAASALFRSVLEKTLKANGYIKTNDPSTGQRSKLCLSQRKGCRRLLSETREAATRPPPAASSPATGAGRTAGCRRWRSRALLAVCRCEPGHRTRSSS